jgi:hypothetical protein
MRRVILIPCLFFMECNEGPIDLGHSNIETKILEGQNSSLCSLRHRERETTVLWWRIIVDRSKIINT